MNRESPQTSPREREPSGSAAGASAGNRAILLTAPGASAIAVVRILGSDVRHFLDAHFGKSARPLRCVHAALRDGDHVLDDIVLVLSEDGQKADLNLHGGPWVIDSVLQLLRREGFEVIEQPPAEPVPLEAFDAGSMLEREMLVALPLARTEAGLRILLAQPQAWRQFVESNPSADVIRSLHDDKSLWHLLRPPRVAIVGPPNVGKSTLANQLFGQERSITADLPGTTRDWVGEIANIDGLPVMLVDTPGQRTTEDEIERTAIEQSQHIIGRADAILLVIDVRPPVSEEQREIESRWQNDPRTLLVVNKVDYRSGWEGKAHALTVATTGEGVDRLRDEIRRFFGCLDLAPHRPRCWTDRQRGLLHSAIADPALLRRLLD